ncbi:MAG: methionyl aminopeptidase [Candidatus Peregrinibacteria bacterium Greene0416_62]|nr:MAG: methionyl aminopeptidase [Candidatus Peregrinibacteria bacterium Greene0416_62]
MPQCQIFTPAEIALFRKSGSILRGCLDFLAGKAVAGISTLELDRLSEEYIRSKGGIPAFKGYKGFAHTLCTSINEEVVHGIPTKRVLKDGDIISLDCGVAYEGIITDACVSVGVGIITKEAAHLLDVTKRALDAGVAAVRGGCRVGDISSAVQQVVEGGGLLCVSALTGHGLGYTVHQFPDVPNIGKRGTGATLPVGTAIAIEPIVTSGLSDSLSQGDDGWTLSMQDGALSAHFEHTIVVTEKGCEVVA